MNENAMTIMPTFQPEKLNLWDRFFNRYRKEVFERGIQHWTNDWGQNRVRDWIEYRVIDRLTGSVTIKREYLN